MAIGRDVSMAMVVMLLSVAGCAPLPGRTLDPLYMGRGPRGEGGLAPVRDQWVGRYEDSRGSGELVVQLRRTGLQLEGIWQLRTGGEGNVTGAVVEGGPRVRFQLGSPAGSCLVLLDGVGEISGDTWTATYSGRDCQGTITDGRFSLTKR